MDFLSSTATKCENISANSAAVCLTLINTETRQIVDVVEVDTPEEALRIYRQHAVKGIDAHIRAHGYDRLILSMKTP